MRQLSLSLLLFFFFSSQVLAAERQPGTDDYLRGEVGLSNEQLSKEIPTEQRSPFALADGKGTLYDPTGDVLTRAGTTSPVNLAWGDLITASIFKNKEQKAWYFTLEMAEAIPEKPSVNVNFLFYFDVDGEKTNNDVDGIRIHADTQFIIAMDPTSFAWKPEYRWYNKEQKFWAFNKETRANVQVQGTQVELLVPF